MYMKKKDLEKLFPDITDEQVKELCRLESDAYEKGKSEAEKAYNKAELARLLKEGIKSAGAKNEKAVTALLDIEKIYIENGELKGFAEQIELIKKESEYLFDIPQKKPQFTAKNQNTEGTSKKDFDAMGYKKRLKLFSENPELYKRLTNR